jgi:hypothetical protein
MASCGRVEKFCKDSDADGVICRCQLAFGRGKPAQYIFCGGVATCRLVPSVAVHCRRCHSFIDAALALSIGINIQPLNPAHDKNLKP